MIYLLGGAGCGGDAGDSVLCGSGSSGSVGAASSRILGAVKRAKLPLVMVQSTEDALIGSPLALILKREVGEVYCCVILSFEAP